MVLFIGIALYSTVRLIEASKRRRQREKVSRNVSYAVHSLVIVLGITRALALVLFPCIKDLLGDETRVLTSHQIQRNSILNTTVDTIHSIRKLIQENE